MTDPNRQPHTPGPDRPGQAHDNEPAQHEPTEYEPTGNPVLDRLLRELNAAVHGLVLRVNDLENTPGPPAAATPPEPDGADGPGDDEQDQRLLFGSLAIFVEDFFTQVYARPMGGSELRWCARWWDHGEAVQRLHLLWERYEVLHRQPGGLATWVGSYLDHQLPILLGPTGPFARCKVTDYGDAVHDPAPPLPVEPAPAGDPVARRPGDDHTTGPGPGSEEAP